MFPLMNATGPSLSLQKQAHTITGTPPWSSLLQIFLRANFSHLFLLKVSHSVTQKINLALAWHSLGIAWHSLGVALVYKRS